MFSIYGITGRVFHGSWHDLAQVAGLWPARASAKIGTHNEESGGTGLPLAARQAQQQYTQTRQLERERGPVLACRDIMHQPVVTIAHDASAQAAWALLQQHGIHQCPVVRDGQLQGLVSDRDLLTALVIDGERVRPVLQRTVGALMRTPVLAVGVDTDVRHLATLMIEQKLDGVPVLTPDGQLCGFISKTDILRAVATEPMLSLWG